MRKPIVSRAGAEDMAAQKERNLLAGYLDILDERRGIRSRRMHRAMGIPDIYSQPPARVLAASVPPRDNRAQPRAVAKKEEATMFRDFADWLGDVRMFALTKKLPERIRDAAPSTASREATGADGGFAVPPKMAEGVMQVIRERSIVGECTVLPVTASEVMLPADEDAPWNATGVAWAAELEALTQSKPQFQGRHMRLSKITAIVPVSDEILEDSALFDAWVKTAIPARIGAKLQTAIIRGTGVGQVEGILNAACAINVARNEAAKVKTEDFAAMFARMHGEGRKRALWLANADVTVPTTPGMELRMHGQPVEWLEACSAIGTRGDLICADLDAFLLAMKGLQIAQSIHVFFDVDATAYRFVLRVAGNPTWSKAYPGQFSSVTRSPFVVLTDAA